MTRLATSSLQYACAVLLFGAPAAAQRPLIADEARRAALRTELRDSVVAVLAAGQADAAFPGAYAVVGDSRGILAEAGTGRLDWAEESPPTDRRTLWDLASLTKVVGTTMALAQLVDRGLVEIYAPVQRYVPDWTGPGRERVRVWHLLTHTSGLPSFRPYDRQTQDPDSLARLLFNTGLERAPGDSMVYSDIGAFMMGEVVERVSGQRLDAYLEANVFRPLRLGETMFNPPESLWPRVAPTEIDTLRGGLVRGKVHDERAYYLGGVAAHAGLFGSAADLARVATMLLRGGTMDGRLIVRATTLRSFTAYADSGRSNRGLGWQKAPAPWSAAGMSSRAYGHTGFTGTSIAVDPALDLYVVLLSNRVNPTRNNPRIGAVRARLANAATEVVRRHAGASATLLAK
jgi:serine-type D-Ala-D-Ala carboxypeptidase